MARTRGIVAFDLDGTLLRGRTVCEILAEPLGRMEEMKRFEAFTSEADIAEARAEIAAWYAGQTRNDLLQHLRNARWADGASEAVALLQGEGIELAIASVTWKFAVGWFAEQLKVHHYLGTDLLPSGEIAHVWARDKAHWLTKLARKYDVDSNRIAAIGDSNGDAEMLRVAAIRFFVGATPPSDVGGVIHLPDANLAVIAQHILQEWAT